MRHTYWLKTLRLAIADETEVFSRNDFAWRRDQFYAQ